MACHPNLTEECPARPTLGVDASLYAVIAPIQYVEPAAEDRNDEEDGSRFHGRLLCTHGRRTAPRLARHGEPPRLGQATIVGNCTRGGEQNSKTYSRGRTLSLTGALWPVETRLKTPAPGPLWPADGLVSGDLCLIRTRSEALWPEVATVL